MADTFNLSLFQEQIDAAGIPNTGVNSSGVIFPLDGQTFTAQQLAAIETVKTAHNPAQKSQIELLAVAQSVVLTQAKVFLRNALFSANPDVLATYTTVKAFVDGNPKLVTGVNNQLAIIPAAAAWTGQNTTERRYLYAVEMAIGLIG